jgi:hypothetical protein
MGKLALIDGLGEERGEMLQPHHGPPVAFLTRLDWRKGAFIDYPRRDTVIDRKSDWKRFWVLRAELVAQ